MNISGFIAIKTGEDGFKSLQKLIIVGELLKSLNLEYGKIALGGGTKCPNGSTYR